MRLEYVESQIDVLIFFLLPSSVYEMQYLGISQSYNCTTDYDITIQFSKRERCQEVKQPRCLPAAATLQIIFLSWCEWHIV